MEFRIGILTMLSFITMIFAIPTSLVEEIKSTELRDNKVKRAHPDVINPEVNSRDVPYYKNPSAIKRGTNFNLKTPNPEQQTLNEWEQEQAIFQNPDLANISPSLYSGNGNPFDDKSIAEYEKGFQYGTNKEKLDEALENAVLKSELYGDQSAVNQYRYYGTDERRRKRRNAKKLRLESRIKREVDLTPEEILTILSLYENNRQPPSGDSYRPPWHRLEQNFEFDSDLADDTDFEQDDGNWLDTPVYPHIGSNHVKNIGPSYMFDDTPQPTDKRGRWGGFADNKKKRYMVAKKRDDPTHELRFINGPNKNDFYTLSQLLSNQREPNVPLYHRFVL